MKEHYLKKRIERLTEALKLSNESLLSEDKNTRRKVYEFNRGLLQELQQYETTDQDPLNLAYKNLSQLRADYLEALQSVKNIEKSFERRTISKPPY